jgi:Transposase
MLGIILEESDYLEVRIPKRLFDGWPLLQHSDYLLHPESLFFISKTSLQILPKTNFQLGTKMLGPSMDTYTQSVSGAVVGPAKSPKRQLRTIAEKRQIVEETMVEGASVARIARAHGVNANQVFYWRMLHRKGRLGA